MKLYNRKPTGNGNEYTKISIDYQKGGMNYYNYKTENRGIYCYFQKVTIEESDGYSIETILVYGEQNFKILLKNLGRKSEKKMQELWGKISFILEGLHDFYRKGDVQGASNLLETVK